MPDIVLFVLTLFVASALFALLEIQIEGPDGWARELPTWTVDAPWSRWLLGGRPLTGYHLYAILSVLALVHVPLGLDPSLASVALELKMLAFFVLFWVLEDFLWFVFNPAYGLRGFRRERIWWHAETWWWIMPRGYWIFVPLGAGLYALARAV